MSKEYAMNHEKNIADVIAEVVDKALRKKSPTSGGRTKIITLRPPSIEKIEDKNE